MWELLRSGLNWASTDKPIDNMDTRSDQERLVILRALERLSPSADSVDVLSVSGSMVEGFSPHRQFRLTKGTTKRAREERVRLEQKLQTTEETALFRGFVRYVDPDMSTLMLRTPAEINSVPPQGITLLIATEENFRLAQELDNTAQQVSIVGIRSVSPLNRESPWTVESITVTSGISNG